MHHTRSNSEVFTQSAHIPTYFDGGHYYHLCYELTITFYCLRMTDEQLVTAVL
jgi:hypothetical protein